MERKPPQDDLYGRFSEQARQSQSNNSQVDNEQQPRDEDLLRSCLFWILILFPLIGFVLILVGSNWHKSLKWWLATYYVFWPLFIWLMIFLILGRLIPLWFGFSLLIVSLIFLLIYLWKIKYSGRILKWLYTILGLLPFLLLCIFIMVWMIRSDRNQISQPIFTVTPGGLQQSRFKDLLPTDNINEWSVYKTQTLNPNIEFNYPKEWQVYEIKGRYEIGGSVEIANCQEKIRYECEQNLSSTFRITIVKANDKLENQTLVDYIKLQYPNFKDLKVTDLGKNKNNLEFAQAGSLIDSQSGELYVSNGKTVYSIDYSTYGTKDYKKESKSLARNIADSFKF